MGSRIQMVGTTSGGAENALASVDVPRNGHIVAVTWVIQVIFDTTGDKVFAQVSFGSVQSVANDSRQVISNAATYLALPTAVGGILGQINYQDDLPDIVVNMGERLYLHALSSAATVASVYAMLSFDFDLDQALVRRR